MSRSLHHSVVISFSGGILNLVYELQKEVGVLLTPPTEKQKADTWMGLEVKRELQLKYHDAER